jgi:nucleotide-binding universal stress UspA family protein
MFEKVLVGVDGRAGGRDAIALARRLADSPATLVLANVCAGAGLVRPGVGIALADERAHAHRLLTNARLDSALSSGTIVRRDSSPGRGLHELAEHERADLLVVGSSHRASLGRVLLGDDTRAALNGAPCAVAIAPRGYSCADAQWHTIGVGHDGSPESELALDAARRLARRLEATIRVLAVVPLQPLSAGGAEPLDWTDATTRAIAAERARLAQLAGVSCDVVYGSVSEELAGFAGGVQLMVVGSRGYGPVGRLLSGSTSSYLARHSACPLLVMPRSAARGRGRSGDRSDRSMQSRRSTPCLD